MEVMEVLADRNGTAFLGPQHYITDFAFVTPPVSAGLHP